MSVLAKDQVRSARGAFASAALPALFVVLWSTGFIGAKFGLPYAGPLTFLALRFTAVAAIMLALFAPVRAAWPRSWREAGHTMLVGVLIQGVYLGGVFFAIAHGIAAGIAALIVGLQPLLTAALVGRVLGERVSPRQWLGLALGLAGIVLVLWGKLVFDPGQRAGLATVIAALLGITIGTLYQKRYCGGVDLRGATALQNATAAGFMLLLLGLGGGERAVDWQPEFVFALAWLCLVLSVGATMLLLLLIRRGAAARVAGFFYLVPPVTALMAFLFFHETLGPLALLGMAVAATGVALVNRG